MKNGPASVFDRLIEAAVQLFSRQGYRGTSTRQIARLADVNETSLFRYFPRKQNLFWAALQSRLERIRIPRELQNGLTQDGAPELVLPLIIEFIVQTSMYQPELTRLLWVSLFELRPGAEAVYQERVAPILQIFTDYMEHNMGTGTLRSCDASLTTVALMATIVVNQELHPLLSKTGQSYAKADEAVVAYSRFWLEALTPALGANLPAQPRQRISKRSIS